MTAWCPSTRPESIWGVPRAWQREPSQAWSLQKSQLSPHVQLCDSCWEEGVLVCPSVCFWERGGVIASSSSLCLLEAPPPNMKAWGKRTQCLSRGAESPATRWGVPLAGSCLTCAPFPALTPPKPQRTSPLFCFSSVWLCGKGAWGKTRAGGTQRAWPGDRHPNPREPPQWHTLVAPLSSSRNPCAYSHCPDRAGAPGSWRQ